MAIDWKRLASPRWLKIPVFILCLAPVIMLAWKAFHQDLGANPIEFITHATGDWTLRFLAITLAVSPLRRLLGLPQLIRFRRMLGLFAFFYGSLHFTTYLWLDKFFNFDEIVKDVWKRPFITAGFLGFVSMAPLALTSTTGWIRRLGGRRWQMLHRLIYVSAIAGVVHYYWLVKSDVRKPLFYGAIVLLLLAERAVAAFRKSRVKQAAWTSGKPGGGDPASPAKARASSSAR
ncbi:MAG TPA: protein-methionine-sulfoxide reductase heme-binding subunit MsrQ [Bryobacteraceae bacterium]|jgi:sulfoxide reductase heme-binding subunit YedZ|nr:protein-methionine-sulfoxide reductase heme-binding subunit MsrQ [Bryobacteraceae bacterium]